MRWYSLEGILEKSCDYNFIFSGRGPGKSTAIVNHLIDCWLTERSEWGKPSQFVRIVRYDWAISRVMMRGWFNEVNQKKLSESGWWVDFKGGEFRARPLHDDGARDEDDPYEVMGFVLPLNAQDDYKSGVDYSNVSNVVFEEFVQLRERDYVDHEVDLFMSALSTIVRNRHGVRCWFIGNTLTKTNPYFDMFGIDLNNIEIQPGDIRTYRVQGYGGNGATIALEYAQMAQGSVDEIAPLMRVDGNVTATSGVFATTPAVEEYADRTAMLSESDFSPALPVAGAYLGSGRFCRILLSKRPVWDDARLICLRSCEPTAVQMTTHDWLNLSGAANPRCDYLGMPVSIRCVSPMRIWADPTVMNLLRHNDIGCVHAYETDEMRMKWRHFVDMQPKVGDELA